MSLHNTTNLASGACARPAPAASSLLGLSPPGVDVVGYPVVEPQPATVGCPCGGPPGAGCEGSCGGESCSCGGCAQTNTRLGTAAVARITLEATAFAASASNQLFPATGWMDASTVKRVRAHWELRSLTGLFRTAPGFQVANKAHAPGAFNNIGTQRTAVGVYSTDWEDLYSYVDDKLLIRFGWVVRNSSGTALSLGSVAAHFEVELACQGSSGLSELPVATWSPVGVLVRPAPRARAAPAAAPPGAAGPPRGPDRSAPTPQERDAKHGHRRGLCLWRVLLHPPRHTLWRGPRLLRHGVPDDLVCSRRWPAARPLWARDGARSDQPNPATGRALRRVGCARGQRSRGVHRGRCSPRVPGVSRGPAARGAGGVRPSERAAGAGL